MNSAYDLNKVEEPIAVSFKIQGVVQGVGFRPFIYALASQHALKGWVRNTSRGVEIEVVGFAKDVAAFAAAIPTHIPPMARIDHFETHPATVTEYPGFEILPSKAQPNDYLPISPDTATCPDCLRELFNPDNRRFRYPFINCTNCGPRFSIVADIPYDRANTTMSGFVMCPECQAEYDHPFDRRFHAQPTACPVCGPQLSFVAAGINQAQGEAALQMARQWLMDGKIVAIKGLGGFLLACDAANPQTVAELRRRKHRSDKAFALMAADLDTIRRHCLVSEVNEALLVSRMSPIVLMEKKEPASLPEAIAPHQKTLGFMLPYTPLHSLLMEAAPGMPAVLVMTSGNSSEEPIAYRDDDAFERLSSIADGFLTHDRPIQMRLDDSVAMEVHQRPYLLRRSRGYAPDAILLNTHSQPVIAAGAELKSSFCLARDQYAFLSHFIGDLENFETLRSFEEAVDHYERLFRFKAERIACDLHPDYLASRYAHQRALHQSLPLIEVQHHHAHLAACLADNGWADEKPVIGLIFDGTGLGTDRAIWGGEVLIGGYRSYQRYAHLAYTPQPGGDASARKPARMALAHLWQAGIDWEADFAPVEALCAEERTILRSQLEKHIHAPLTSSMGRLFDAASAFLGIRQTATYEGQAAIEMENLCASDEHAAYEFDIHNGIINPSPLWVSLIHDWRSGIPTPILAARIHNSVVEMNLRLCQAAQQASGIGTVALSGGVWQNRYLLEHTLRRLEGSGFNVLWHRQVPCNDGSIALGQAVIAGFTIQ